MYRNAIPYKDTWLAPGSDAFQMHQDRKFKELDEHLKRTAEEERKRSGK